MTVNAQISGPFWWAQTSQGPKALPQAQTERLARSLSGRGTDDVGRRGPLQFLYPARPTGQDQVPKAITNSRAARASSGDYS